MDEAPIGDVVEQMRRDITVNLVGANRETEGDVGGFRVSFQSSDPHLAMKITERLTGMIVSENLRGAARPVQLTGR